MTTTACRQLGDRYMGGEVALYDQNSLASFNGSRVVIRRNTMNKVPLGNCKGLKELKEL